MSSGRCTAGSETCSLFIIQSLKSSVAVEQNSESLFFGLGTYCCDKNFFSFNTQEEEEEKKTISGKAIPLGTVFFLQLF